MKKKNISKKNSCKKCKIVKKDLFEMVNEEGNLTKNFYNIYRHKDLSEGKGSFKLDGNILKHKSFLRPHTETNKYNLKNADTYTEPIGHISVNGQMKIKNGKIIYKPYHPEQLCNIFIDRPQLNKTTYSVNFLLTNFFNIYKLRKKTGDNYQLYHNLFSGNNAIDQSDFEQKLLLQIKSLSKFNFLENTIANIVDIDYDGVQWTFTLGNIYSSNEAAKTTNPWLEHPDINKKRHHHFLETSNILPSGTFGKDKYYKQMGIHEEEEVDPQDIENTTYLYKGDIFTNKKMREQFKNIYLDKLVDTDEWHNCSFEITFIGWIVAVVEVAVDIAVGAGTALVTLTTDVITEIGVTASAVVNSLGGLLGGAWGAGAVVADAAVDTAGLSATEVAADDAAASLSTEFAGDITSSVGDATEEAAQTALENNELVDESSIENSVNDSVDSTTEAETAEESSLTAKGILTRVINYLGYLGYLTSSYSLVEGIITDNWTEIIEGLLGGVAGAAFVFSPGLISLAGIFTDSELIESINTLTERIIGAVIKNIGISAEAAPGLANALAGIYTDYGNVRTSISDLQQIENATKSCFQLTNPNPGEGCTNLPLTANTITNADIQNIIKIYKQASISGTDYNSASTSKNNFYKSAITKSAALSANLSLLNKWLASLTPNDSTITLSETIQLSELYNSSSSTQPSDATWNNSPQGTQNITIAYTIGNTFNSLNFGVQNGIASGGTCSGATGSIQYGESGIGCYNLSQNVDLVINQSNLTGTFTIDNVIPGETWMWGEVVLSNGGNYMNFGFQLPANITNNNLTLTISNSESPELEIIVIDQVLLTCNITETNPETTLFNNYKNKNVSAMINTIIDGMNTHQTALTKQMFYGNKTGTKIMCGAIPTANTANGAALMNLQPNNTTKSVTFWPTQYTGESNGYLYLNNNQGSMVAVNIYFLNESGNPNVNKPVQYENKYIMACGIPNGGGFDGYRWGAIYQEENSNTFYLAGSGEAGQSLDLSSYDTNRYTNEPDSIGSTNPQYIYFGDLIQIFNLYDIQTEQGAQLSYYKDCEINDSNNPPTIFILTKLNQFNTYSSTLPVGKFPNTFCTT